MSIRPYIVFSAVACLALLVAGCSTEKNTAKSRWWQAFNTRYNVYYNGNVAYIEGGLEKEEGNQDNFTEIIPLYTVGNKNSRQLGKANFDRAIEKAQKAIKLHSIKRRPTWNHNRRKTDRDIEWLGRKEYNPFLWKAWMLMGRAQFHQGDFDAASSTFNYMSRLYETQPAIYGRARAWLAKSYIENGFLYDAEDVIRNMERDSLHWRARKEWDYTYADYYIHTKEYDKAIPYLKKVIGHEMRKKQKAREYFLLGQLEAALGRTEDAYRSFGKVIRMNPPFELEFNARVARTEVMAGRQSKKMISQLRRMAASDKNKEFLDQVYYALGNIYLLQRDTAQAISCYEKGNAKATRSGIEKGVLLLKLGDLYWIREQYGHAQRCYGEAIGLLDKERDDYRQLDQRSRILDELVPHTEAVHLQDSLQQLARMSERDRNAAIDRVIDALKKREKEERDRLAEEYAQQVMQQNGGVGNTNRPVQPSATDRNRESGMWYFYNTMAVQQGKQQFQRLWGKRQNVDNWQRNNQTVVAGMGNFEPLDNLTEEQRDSMVRAEAVADSLKQITDSAQNNPHRREYYLAQIPFNEEQLAASDLIIMDGLYNSGVIFKDKLDNLPLAEKALMRLTTHYPAFGNMEQAYYHLFLLYSRMGHTQTAQTYIDRMKAEYPSGQWTKILTDPYFVQDAREGVHIEDSLYAATYEAFKAGRLGEVRSNVALSETRFALGANRDKFLFIGGLSKLNGGDGDGCVADMQTLVENHPKSALAEMAGMILNGVRQGRRLHGGTFDLGNVWQRRSVVLGDNDTTRARTLTNERNTNFVFMLVYRPDSVNQNKLLFELARYNFTNYMVRDFDINIENEEGLSRMMVSGFRNYDEALQYARQLLKQESVTQNMGKARPVIVSEDNLPLLGTTVSYDDYSKYYSKHFAPLKISTYYLLSEPADIVTKPARESDAPITESEIDNFLNNTFVAPEEPVQPAGTTIPNGDFPLPEQPETPVGTIIPTDEPTPATRPGTTVIPAETAPTDTPGTTVIPLDTPEPTDTRTTVIPTESVPTVPAGSTVIPVTEETAPTRTVVPPSPSTAGKNGGTAPTGQNNTPRPSTQPVRATTTPPAGTTVPRNVRRPQPTIVNGAEIILDNMDSIPPSKARPKAPAKRTTTPTGAQVGTTNTTGTKPSNDKTPAGTTPKAETKPKTFDLEDEYYDLEGF